MSLIDVMAREAAREERDLRVRMALGVKMLTNAGYAMIGGTFFKAASEQKPISALTYVWAAAGIVALGLALFFAPEGAGDGDGG